MPNGRYYFKGRILAAADHASLQGLSVAEQKEFGLHAISPFFLKDLVGNGFSTSVCTAVLIVALEGWSR